MEDRISKLEQKLEEVIKELIQTKSIAHQVNWRYEALLRDFLNTGKYTMDNLFSIWTNYQALFTKINEIQSMPAIKDRIKAAVDYNQTGTGYKCTADALNVIPIIEQAGGTSDEILFALRNDLECSNVFSQQLKKYERVIIQDNGGTIKMDVPEVVDIKKQRKQKS